ncbi:Rieske (2Fe-2S) protein [Haladaptatus pallidirubidus]|uniref:Rieske domain-containing protein n=1 Tax=Haladaptatus pallidirubidus TaxID=1008152 RepID=A0AAV3UJ01_9EURY|nr:Rieske (2Fe-2S) protein [Haladaptatus pallidirubidus]
MSEKRFEICSADDLKPGDRHIKTLTGFSVGVFNVDGEYYAMKNDCPHQRAPLCEGKLTGTSTSDTAGEYNWERDGQILTCPWHGWEFDVTTGESVFNPHRVKAKTFETRVEPSQEGADCSETSSKGSVSDEAGMASDGGNCEGCGHHIEGSEPLIETYDVEVEHGTVVVYL